MIKTAEQILIGKVASPYKLHGGTLYNERGNMANKEVLEAMKEISELAFDAGYERACEEELSSNLTAPDKEQFIKELFRGKED